MTMPDGWTDDMNIPLPPSRTVEDVVQFVIQAPLGGTADADIERLLSAEFLLSPDDAALARDRIFGGIVRAATRRIENCPRRETDPMAWESFQRATRDPSIVAMIYPEYAQPAESVAGARRGTLADRISRYLVIAWQKARKALTL